MLYFCRLILTCPKISQTFVTLKIILSMAGSVYKWLGIPVFAALFLFNVSGGEKKGQVTLPDQHPFHVSVVEINHNANEKTLEISCKIFTDDFENVLKQNYKTKVDLINPPERRLMDTLVKKYLLSHLGFTVNDKSAGLSYIGFEHESEAIYGYLQASNIPSIKKIDITNSLMHDMFTDQINLIHMIEAGERKSTKLDYPSKSASFSY